MPVIGTKVQRKHILLYLESMSLKAKQQVKNLGIQYDGELSFNSHITKAKDMLSYVDRKKKLSYAFVLSRIDYWNALLSGLPKKLISNLQ